MSTNLVECIICAFPIDCVERIFSLTPCSHNEPICSMCFLKIRALQRSFKCPTCKRELENVICTTEQGKKFEDFQIWGDSIGENYSREPRSQMFFPKDYYQHKVSKLWTYQCITCGQIRRDMKSLRGHCNAEHNLLLCLLCDEYKQIFPSEQRTYTQYEYDRHLRFGDGDGSIGHPNCEFCRKRFYDSTALFQHLTREHESCHLCERAGLKFKYFQDYKNLERHFRKDHFVCEDPMCLEKKFVAFGNEIDLVAHNVQYHPALTINRTINVQFKFRRNVDTNEKEKKSRDSNNNDEAGPENTRTAKYEGGLGGRAQDGEWQVELQPITSDPRDPNRNMNADIVDPMATSANAEEDFPQLPSNASAALIASNRWINMKSEANRSTKKTNDFPSLPTSNKPKKQIRLAVAKPAATQPSSSKKHDIQSISSEYERLSEELITKPSAATGSLSDWAKVKVDNKGKLKSTKAKPVPSNSSSNTIDDTEIYETLVTPFESLTPSSSGKLSSENVDVPIAEVYPTLGSLNEKSETLGTSQKSRPPVKPKANTDWNDALKSIGMTSSSKKQSQKGSLKLVRTANTTAANEKLVVDRKNDDDSIWRIAATETKQNNTTTSVMNTPLSTSSKKQGNWVRIGGAERDVSTPKATEQRRYDPNFPSLG